MLNDFISTELLRRLTDFGIIIISAGFVYLILKYVVVRLISKIADKTRTDWDRTFVRRGVFNRLALLAPGIVVHIMAGSMFAGQSAWQSALQTTASLWMMLFALLTLYSVLDAVNDIYNSLSFSKQLPLRSFIQIIKLAAFLAFFIIMISALLGKSPALLISGLGAMTAVLMLIFKDPILGFVAGIQLSANRMLSVGDWLEMPKYNADGDVIDITLTTVKVKNWDNTITTIPTYALIADSFKNWRGMQEAGGRRISRNIYIDMTSIHFLANEEVERLRKAQLLCKYIDEKLAAIDAYNKTSGIDPSSPMNGRRLTNIGTFRAYLLAYLKAHPGIHKTMLCMVRQLQPTEHGLPMQIYAFTAETSWPVYESVQADIFDHILAVTEEFGLRVHQSPSSADVQRLAAVYKQ